MGEKASRDWWIVGGAIGVFLALVACGFASCGVLAIVSANRDPTPKAPGAPCENEWKAHHMDSVVCDDGSIPPRLATESNYAIAVLSPGTSVVKLRRGRGEPPKPDTIHRKPGQVDALICVLSGPHAGDVGYIPNTHIYGSSCP